MAGMYDNWSVSPEERAKHDAQFFQLKPISGFITGEQAKGFFLLSGLPPPVLGHIWGLADMDADGKMDKREFSIAMFLIQKKLQGQEIPKVLPASLKQENVGSLIGNIPMSPPPSMPVPSIPGPQPSMSAPAIGSPDTNSRSRARSVSDGEWIIPHGNKLKYTQLFNQHDRSRRGVLLGVEAKGILMQTGVPQHILAQIWSLSDIDNDGKLTTDEFCVAMHLVDMAKTGQALPRVLPLELIPPSYRRDRKASLTGSTSVTAMPPVQPAMMSGPPIGMVSPVMPFNSGQQQAIIEDDEQVTFEDKRRENFEKGQAELDRRRALLREQQKKEEEARHAAERAEYEKRERIRLEQERKKQIEMEKQMQRQREIEHEREEQRRKALEQREQARREMERHRQMEWERQRVEQLLIEKKKEQEIVLQMKTQTSTMAVELETLDNKKMDYIQKTNQARNAVTEISSAIENMRLSRDSKLKDIEKLQRDIQDCNQRLMADQKEKEELNIKAQTSTQSNPISDTYRTVMHSHGNKQLSIQRMKAQLEQVEKETATKLSEIDNNNTILNDLNNKISQVEQSIQRLRTDLSRRQAYKEKLENEEKKEAEKKSKPAQDWLNAFNTTDIFASGGAPAQQPADEDPFADDQQKDSWANFLTGSETESKDKQPKPQADVWGDAFGEGADSAQNDEVFGPPTSTFEAFESTTKTESFGDSSSFAAFGTDTFSTTTTGPATTKVGFSRYKALYPFEARNADELTVKPGDIVQVSDDQTGAEPGWMGGEMNGKTGWFPQAYVEKLVEDTATLALTDKKESTQQQSEPTFDAKFDIQGTTADESTTDGQDQTQTLNMSDQSPFTTVVPSNITSAPSPTPGQGQTVPEGLQAQALYPWRAKKDNHLTFNKGDIMVVKEQQDMWWLGEFNGKIGWFPKSYVKLIGTVTTAKTTDSRSNTPVTSAKSPPTVGSPQHTTTTDNKGTPSECFVAMYNYQSSEPGDLCFNQGEIITVTKSETDWWTGSLGDRTGIFPANYVKKMEMQVTSDDDLNTSELTSPQQQNVLTASPSPTSPPEPASSLPGQNSSTSTQKMPGVKLNKKPEIASVIASYTATGQEQLSLSPGQLISVRKKSPSGWWEGELQAKGQKRKIGWFPANYVRLLGTSSARSTPDSSVSPGKTEPNKSESETPTSSLQSPTGEQVVALYGYTAANDDELTFHKGSIISVIGKEDKDWWRGELNGNTGVFPSNYVKSLNETSPSPAPTSSVEGKAGSPDFTL